MKKKRILIVSYLFAPNNAIGAIRPTKIAAGLIRKGYEVDVVTCGASSNDSFADISNVTNKYVMIPYQEPSENTPEQTFNPKIIKFGSLRYWLMRHKAAVVSLKAGNKFNAFFKVLYENKLKHENYDAVLTSFGPLASLQCGLYIKKRVPKTRWICDFRDPVVTLTPLLFKPYMQYYQDTACKKADVIVAVSDGYLRRICNGRYREKAYMIPNGYDATDITNIRPDIYNEKKLKLVYVGALYNGKRDLSPVFRVIRELIDERFVELEKLSFEYAGSDYEAAVAQAASFHLEKIIVNHGKLSRAACLKLQTNADMLVLVTWNYKNEEGVFPGKFLEYMLVNKPVIAVVNGELANSEVAKVVADGHFGVCFEEANYEMDHNKLKAYLKEQYTAFFTDGSITFTPDQTIRDRYNYENIISRIEGLIND